MIFQAHYAGIRAPIETCLVGSGSFGRSDLAQAREIPLVNARIAADVTTEAAGRGFAAAAPSYLVANRRLARTVRAGEAFRLGNVEIAPDSGLLAMRRRQDSLFAGGG